MGVIFFLVFEKVVETVNDTGPAAGGVEEAVAGVKFRKGAVLAMREIEEGYVHMRDTAIRLVIGVDGQEVCVYGSDVFASCLCDHGFECLESPLVALEGEQLACPRSISPILIATNTHTLPLFPISALRYVVLFPGAAVASMTVALFEAGGLRTRGGKQDALSWRMSLPDLYAASSWKAFLGEKRRSSGTWASCRKLELVGGENGTVCGKGKKRDGRTLRRRGLLAWNHWLVTT